MPVCCSAECCHGSRGRRAYIELKGPKPNCEQLKHEVVYMVHSSPAVIYAYRIIECRRFCRRAMSSLSCCMHGPWLHVDRPLNGQNRQRDVPMSDRAARRMNHSTYESQSAAARPRAGPSCPFDILHDIFRNTYSGIARSLVYRYSVGFRLIDKSGVGRPAD